MQFTQVITEVKNAVTQQVDAQVEGGGEESAAVEAASTSDEVVPATPPTSVATSLNSEVPFGIPKSNYSLHRPTVGTLAWWGA